MSEWLEANGVPAANAISLGPCDAEELALLYKRADAAVFTNRAEGGTNLVSELCVCSWCCWCSGAVGQWGSGAVGQWGRG